MKTLDEIIEVVEDRAIHFNAVGCFYCHYSNHVECVDGCVLADALHYLKEYSWMDKALDPEKRGKNENAG